MKHEYYTCDRCGRKVDIAYRLYAVGGDESKPLADIDLCSDCLYEVKDLITRPVDQTEKVSAPAAEAVAAPPSEEIGKPSTASARDSENSNSAYNTAAEAAPADTASSEPSSHETDVTCYDASSEPSSHETDVTCYDASTSKAMTKLAKELAASTEKHEKEHPREGHGQQKHGLSKVKHYKAAPFERVPLLCAWRAPWAGFRGPRAQARLFYPYFRFLGFLPFCIATNSITHQK